MSYEKLHKIKDYDLRTREGDLIMLTGNYYNINEFHGVVVETEVPYESNYDSWENETIFENYLPLSIAAFTTGEFIKRERPDGFISKNCSAKELEFKTQIKKFNNKYKSYLESTKLKHLDTSGGITVASNEGAAFDLNSVKRVKKAEKEVIKRLSFSLELIKEINEKEHLAKELFDSIEEDMKKQGCISHTLRSPDGEYLRRFSDFSKTAELRAYGLKK